MVRLHTVARKRLQKSSGVPFQDGHASTQAKTASPVTPTFESFSFGSRQFEFLIFVHSDMYVCQLPTAIPPKKTWKGGLGRYYLQTHWVFLKRKGTVLPYGVTNLGKSLGLFVARCCLFTRLETGLRQALCHSPIVRDLQAIFQLHPHFLSL